MRQGLFKVACSSQAGDIVSDWRTSGIESTSACARACARARASRGVSRDTVPDCRGAGVVVGEAARHGRIIISASRRIASPDGLRAIKIGVDAGVCSIG